MNGKEPPTPSPTSTPWPNGAKCAISFTMDNLGEAQDVNKGLWPDDRPIGQHPSVLSTLPRMLDLLDHHQQQHGDGSGGIKATYFAESWSLDVYPDAVRELTRRGHEVAWHGYQHETWHQLSAEEEALNFERSFAKAGGEQQQQQQQQQQHGDGGAAVVVSYEGFRPPGGELNGDRTYELLRRYGVSYVSPLGAFGISGGGVVVLPFEWETVDAFWYMDKFSSVRVGHGVPEEAPGPGAFREYLLRKFDEVKRDGGYISILFHPFLQTSEERFGVLEEVLARISSDEEIWCAPCGEVAKWVREHAVTSQPLALLPAEHLLDGHHVRPLHVPDVPRQVLPQPRQRPPELVLPTTLTPIPIHIHIPIRRRRVRAHPHRPEVQHPLPEPRQVRLPVLCVLVPLARPPRRPREDEEVHGHEVPRQLPAEALLELALELRVRGWAVAAAAAAERGVELLEGAVVALHGV
ncbi:hypothetical protein VMCG_04496 [Cytospora schulzeri]|uniref:NodB homology domain-containing protein n=1 Tax=Cytospora schulzeri TaxID=448051 RepID=A0A423WS94_9PEZI|nr:hypothetical protein VMCG_04496 [Valsa malicola]